MSNELRDLVIKAMEASLSDDDTTLKATLDEAESSFGGRAVIDSSVDLLAQVVGLIRDVPEWIAKGVDQEAVPTKVDRRPVPRFGDDQGDFATGSAKENPRF